MTRKTYQSGTDLIDPSDVQGSIDRLLAFHRATFGSAVMEATGGDTGGGDNGEGGGEGGTGEQPPAGGTGEQPPADDDKSKDLYSDPEKARAEIERLRRENAASRANAKQKAADDAVKQVTDKIAEALGLKKGEEKPTADQLVTKLAEATEDGKQARVELAVYKSAAKHQGDPSALLDSRSFLEKVKGLDPASADFQKQVDTAIKEAVDNNPKLKAVQASGKSAVDHAGGTGEKKQPIGLNAAVNAAYAGK